MAEASERRTARGRGRPSLTERHRETVRLEISRAAVELFRSRGVERTSVAQIAEAVGVSPRTLWRYFSSKEECVAPLLSLGAERLARRLREWPAGDSLVGLFDEESWREDLDAPTRAALLGAMRLTRDEPALRAVWTQSSFEMLHLIADAFAHRAGREEAGLEERVQAGLLIAALHVGEREYAWHFEGEDPDALRTTMNAALRTAVRGLSG